MLTAWSLFCLEAEIALSLQRQMSSLFGGVDLGDPACFSGQRAS